MQGVLFDDLAPLPKPTPERKIDWGALDQVAFVYTATETGANSGIRYAMSVADAQTWCSDPRSAGLGRGARWATFYTSAANFVRHHSGDDDAYGGHAYSVCIKGLFDDGRSDKIFRELGIEKIPIARFADVLEPLGVKVTK